MGKKSNLFEWAKLGSAFGIFMGVLVIILAGAIGSIFAGLSGLLIGLGIGSIIGIGVIIGATVMEGIIFVTGRLITNFVGFQSTKPFWKIYQVYVTGSIGISILASLISQNLQIFLMVVVIGIIAYAGNFGGFRAEISPVTYEKLLTGQWDNAYATQEFTCHADACSVTVGVELQRATANWGSNKWWKAPTIITPAGTVTGPCVTSYSSSGDIFLLRDRKLTANKTVEITKKQKINFTTGASCGGGGYDDQISPTGIWSLKFEEWYKKCDGTWEIVNIYTNQPYVQTSSDSTASWSCPSTYGKCSVSCQGDANIYNGWAASQEQSISRVFISKASCTSLESTYGLNTHKLFDDKYYNIQRAQGPQYSGKVFCPSDVDFCRAKVYDQSGVELTSSGNDNIQKKKKKKKL